MSLKLQAGGWGERMMAAEVAWVKVSETGSLMGSAYSRREVAGGDGGDGALVMVFSHGGGEVSGGLMRFSAPVDEGIPR
ncbi:MAG: hypothetical protein LC114_18265 [Bryobacterales bacterium]|nr:hypothetical protein [Bryobacterales bacterium]